MSPSLANRPFVAASGYKPKLAPYVKRLVVPCPDCGAGVDQFCISASGIPTRSSHQSRKRMAARHALNERSAA